MADFTISYEQRCTNTIVSDTINGHKCTFTTDMVNFDWVTSCDCIDYNTRRKKKGELCKHLKELSSKVCSWCSEYSAERQTEEQEEKYLCPVCGSDTEIIKVAR